MACRMLLAAGRFPWPSLLDGFKLMAQNENQAHEYRFRRDHVHEDGWGVMARSAGEVTFHRNPVACWRDPAFTDLYGLTPDLVVLHARRASPGTAIDHESTHPFQDGGCYFCHNGTIYDFAGGESSDSRRFFALILRRSRQCRDMGDAIRRTVSHIKDFSALNFILCRDESCYVLNMYGNRGEAAPNYYTMKYLAAEDYVVISSERLPALGRAWQEMKNGTLLTLTIPQRQIEIRDVRGPRHRG